MRASCRPIGGKRDDGRDTGAEEGDVCINRSPTVIDRRYLARGEAGMRPRCVAKG